MTKQDTLGMYERMKVVMQEGQFPGIYAPIVLDSLQLINSVIDQIKKDIANEENSVGSVESSGRMGNDKVRNRGRKSNQRKAK